MGLDVHKGPITIATDDAVAKSPSNVAVNDP